MTPVNLRGRSLHTQHVISVSHERDRDMERDREREGMGERGLLTEHSEFSYLTLSLAHHVGAYTHIFPSITLPGVGDHQLPSSDLRERGGGQKRSEGER